MDILGVAGIAGLGYLLTKDGRSSEKLKPKKELVTENQKPNNENIYNSRYLEDVRKMEFEKADDKFQKSLTPNKTGIIGPAYKDRQDYKYELPYSLSKSMILDEKEVINPEPETTTRFSGAMLSQLETSGSLPPEEYLEQQGIKTVNEKRNRMPYDFTNFNTSKELPKYKTVSNGRPESKSVNVYYDKMTHNNMEPFFGGSVKQNLREDANRTRLEAFTGTDVVYKHKKEVGQLFPNVKNPYVNGLPVSSNYDHSRYIPSIKNQGVKPFAEERVGPGLNMDPTKNEGSIGFQDSYRPLGKGMFRDINEIRVNPKLSYKARITGENFYIKNRGNVGKTESRKFVDLSYTTFKPEDGSGAVKEGFSNIDGTPMKFRDNLPNQAQVIRNQINDKDTIILKHEARDEYADKIDNLKGIVANGRKAGKTSLFDDARSTIKETTERNKYKYLNTGTETKSHIVNPYDKAKITIKQQTEKQLHSHINRNDGDRRGQTYQFDDARTTIKETTHTDYTGIVNSNDATVQKDRTNYLNAEINALKELSLKRRKPVEQGAKETIHRGTYGNFDTKKVQFKTTEQQERLAPTAPPTLGKLSIGKMTSTKQNYKDDELLKSRIQPEFLDQFNKNPYTQKLTSHIKPYNPKFPILRN